MKTLSATASIKFKFLEKVMESSHTAERLFWIHTLAELHNVDEDYTLCSEEDRKLQSAQPQYLIFMQL
ncbi:hypothetical protein [Nitrosomonas sp. Is79A3]|uniref:hypothetical protein n=1 Tax=Nitrosomonas sp. (strain Is79A3) TaxID=261292 RepID=UPI0002F91763